MNGFGGLDQGMGVGDGGEGGANEIYALTGVVGTGAEAGSTADAGVGDGPGEAASAAFLIRG
jgi:hypothetical protein